MSNVIAAIGGTIALGLLVLLAVARKIYLMAKTITEQLAELEAAVQLNTDAEASAIALLERIPQLILDAAQGADPATLARLQTAADTIRAKSTDLANAVLANTPAAPTPEQRAARGKAAPTRPGFKPQT